MAKKQREGPIEEMKLRGFARIHLWERDSAGVPHLKGDSDWLKNTITIDGSSNYIIGRIAGLAGSKSPSHIAIGGTQAAQVSSDATVLTAEYTTSPVRAALTSVLVATRTLQMTATFGSALMTASRTIGAIAVYNTSAAGSLGSGSTFPSSIWATNQDLENCWFMLDSVCQQTGAMRVTA